MRRLTLSLCGPTQVRLDGCELPGPPLGAKPLALLAYLAIERREHARESLTTLLWGEFPDAQARASLRQALAHLRRALGETLVVDRGGVRLDADVDMDVGPLLREGAPAGADVTSLLALDPARFLASLRVHRDGGFEEWAERMRALLRRRHRELLAAAARDAAARLDWAQAARLAERWRAEEPLSADATLLLMEAHHLGGQPGDALAAYSEYRAALQADAGEAPPAVLRTLAARISRAPSMGIPTPAFGVPAVNGAATAANAPLTGRRAEWERLAALWESARHGGGGGVAVLSGELGAGKSRLAADFSRRVAADGGTVLRARAREAAAAIPFSSAADLLRSALDAPGIAAADGEWLSEVARLVPEVRAKLPGVPPAPRASLSGEWRLYEGAAQLVSTLAAEHPLLVLLDDAQWCDAESARVVRVLVERTESLPVLWCIAVGRGLAERDAPGVRLASALGALPHATSLPLAPLGERHVLELVGGAGGATTGEHAELVRVFAERLHAATGGLPGYVLEALRALRARGLLVDGPDGWRPGGALAADAQLAALLDVPSLAEPIRDRILRLGDDGRAVLLTITLAGGTCTPELLSLVHGVSRLRAAAIGDALVDRGLAGEEAGAYRVANQLVAGVCTRLGSDARRREVERALVAARSGATMVTPPPTPVPAPRATGEWRSSV